MTVPVCNTPPTAAVSSTTGSYNLACNGALTLDSSGSSDADAGDAVASWAWTVTNKAGAVVFSSIDPTLTLTNTQLPAGATYSVTLLVADTQGALSAPSPGGVTECTCMWTAPSGKAVWRVTQHVLWRNSQG